MLTFRKTLLLTSGIVAASVSMPAYAQNAGAGAGDQSDIIVTGTRAQGRTRLDSTAPIDVLSAASLRQQGTTEVAAALATVIPSIDFPRTSAVDGTDSVRPATLRGLSPDQTLVLINGVRGHASALLNVNGSVGRGSAAFDLNTIPGVALESIEVLRDGASAQYGSDAIAGVVNLRLREARSGGGGSVTYGQYETDIDAARSSRSASDGKTVTVSAWQGIGLGSEGFLTVSGEYLHRDPTSRGDVDPRATPNTVRSRFGDPEVEQGTFYLNAAHPVVDGWELYGFGGYQFRDSTSAAFPRVPSNVNNVASVYPNGFLPLINVRSKDLTATVGLRGDIGEWATNFKFSYGRNRLDFRTKDSINSTYGAASPTDFYSGALIYDQLVTGVDFSREYALGGGTLNVAWGAEFRAESYEINAGQHESYDRGPLGNSATGGNSAFGSGAQGFGGFQPSNALLQNRGNIAGYIDLEARIADSITLGAAARAEHYSDFGEIVTGKLSARVDIAPWIALRGTASTGFRAPSLQQQYFTSTASVFVAPNIIETGTFPSVSPVAAALGGVALRPEKSTNLSAGTVIRAGGFSLTVDGYWIRIRDQLALSENITLPAAQQTQYGVQAARFFINGVRSTTKGIEAVANYRIDAGGAGIFDLTAAGNFNDIKLNRTPPLSIFGRQRLVSIEQGTPRTKIVGAVDWKIGGFGATVRATHYGDVIQPGSTPAGDTHTGKKTVTDLEARYQITQNVGLAFGANNVFDVYPDRLSIANNSTGTVAFPYYSPFGFNGRFLYGRLNVSW